jgi:hypothetical protein
VQIRLRRWTIEIGAGWAVVAAADHSWVRLFFEGEARNEYHSSTVTARAAELGFSWMAITDGDFDRTVDEVMKRHVGQGYPERSDRTLAGVPARVESWTDGVQQITSHFVRDSPMEILRIDLSISLRQLIFTPDDVRASAAGEQLLATLARDGG